MSHEPVPKGGSAAELHVVRAERIREMDEPTPPDKRDDARQVIAISLAAIQRERAAADGSYLRARNMVTLTGGLFTAAQAALLASVGRESRTVLLLNADERHALLYPAGIAAALLIGAIGFLFAHLDRARPTSVVGAETLKEAWLDSTDPDVAVIDLLALRVLQEEQAWAVENKARAASSARLARLCGSVVLATVVELAMLYAFIT